MLGIVSSLVADDGFGEVGGVYEGFVFLCLVVCVGEGFEIGEEYGYVLFLYLLNMFSFFLFNFNLNLLKWVFKCMIGIVVVFFFFNSRRR